MKKFLIFTLSLFALFLLAFGIFLFVIFQPVTRPGPKAHYRVDEGSVEVFGLKNGEAKSLLGLLGPGDDLVAPTVSDASLKVPFWIDWIGPVIVDAVGRARYFMYKEGKKSQRDEFTVTYTNKTIRKDFVRELEKTRLIKNIQLDFFLDEFSIFFQAVGVAVSGRGVLSVPSGSGRLLLHLKWLKVGSVKLPSNALRAIENLFAKSYDQSGDFSIQLLRVTFQKNTMNLSFRKKGERAAA